MSTPRRWPTRYDVAAVLSYALATVGLRAYHVPWFDGLVIIGLVWFAGYWSRQARKG